MPEVRLGAEDAKRAAHGVVVPGAGTEVVRLTDERGLIALAEPAASGEGLKPIVGLRG